MHAIVVDDLLIARRPIISYMKQLDFDNIFEAKDGIEALELMNNNDIDIVITDWLMPNMDGISLVQKIRASKEYSKIPILMISSIQEKNDIIKALKCGINDFLSKPFSSDVLRAKIESLLDLSNDYLIK